MKEPLSNDLYGRCFANSVERYRTNIAPAIFPNRPEVVAQFHAEKLDKYVYDTLKMVKYPERIRSGFRDRFLPHVRFLELSLVNHIENFVSYKSTFKNASLWRSDELAGTGSEVVILVLINQLYNTLYTASVLFLLGFEYQSKTVFRSYTEILGILTASLLDVDFFNKYVNAPRDTKEYEKHWHKSLRPAAIRKQVKVFVDRMKLSDVDAQLKSSILVIETALLSTAYDNVYKEYSNAAHTHIHNLMRHHRNPFVEGFKISLEENYSIAQNQTLLELIEVSCHGSHLIETLINQRISKLDFPGTYKIRDFLNYVSLMSYVDATYDGLYEFGSTRTRT